MSKRNRYKFRDRNKENSSVIAVQAQNTVAARSNSDSGAAAAHKDEYRIIRSDMIRLVILNGLMLAAVLIVYYTNRSSGYLERLFDRIF